MDLKTRMTWLVITILMTLASTSQAGTVIAYKRDAFFRFYGNPADHTYACVDGRCYAVGNSSRSGGKYVNGRYVNRQSAISASCAGNCYMIYGVNGVCHQHTNRMLYYARTTLNPSVQGYRLTRWVYGTYGDYGGGKGTFRQCLSRCGGN